MPKNKGQSKKKCSWAKRKESPKEAKDYLLSLKELMEGEQREEVYGRLKALENLYARIDERRVTEKEEGKPDPRLTRSNSGQFKRVPTETEESKSEASPIAMGRKKSLTNERVLDAIKKLTEEFGFSPTLEELRRELGVGSKRTVQRYLLALEQEGRIERRGGARGVKIWTNEF